MKRFIFGILALVALFQVGYGQSPYRIRLADSTYAAQLRGVTGTRTAGITITGTYTGNFRAHQFNVTITGRYDLYIDVTGTGSSYSKDAVWSGTVGKTITGKTDLERTVSLGVYADPDSNAQIDTQGYEDLSVTAPKLASVLDLSSKTITYPDSQIGRSNLSPTVNLLLNNPGSGIAHPPDDVTTKFKITGSDTSLTIKSYANTSTLSGVSGEDGQVVYVDGVGAFMFGDSAYPEVGNIALNASTAGKQWILLDVNAYPTNANTYLNPAPTAIYLMSNFQEPGLEGLSILYSFDGVNFEKMFDRPVFVPDSGLRDPSIMLNPWDDFFYICYTHTNYYGGIKWDDNTFGVARSKDLRTWTHVKDVDMQGDSTWAPEWFIDTDSTLRVIVSVSTDGGSTFQLYETHPTSNTELSGSWSSKVQLNVPSGDDISDAQLVYHDVFGMYILAHKFRGAANSGFSATGFEISDDIFGTWTEWTDIPSAIRSGVMGEGQQFLKETPYLYRVYAYGEAYSGSDLRWQTNTLTNFKSGGTLQDVKVRDFVPSHGTVIKITDAGIIDRILNHSYKFTRLEKAPRPPISDTLGAAFLWLNDAVDNVLSMVPYDSLGAATKIGKQRHVHLYPSLEQTWDSKTVLQFDSSASNALTIPHSDSMNFSTGSFTIMFDVKKYDSLTASMDLLYKRTGTAAGWYVGMEYTNGMRLSLYDGTNTQTFRVGGGQENLRGYLEDRWVNIAWVVDIAADSVKLYVDGRQATLTGGDTLTYNNSFDNAIDLKVGGNGTYYNGELKRLMMFDKALSRKEVLAYMAKNPSKDLDNSLRALWDTEYQNDSAKLKEFTGSVDDATLGSGHTYLRFPESIYPSKAYGFWTVTDESQTVSIATQFTGVPITWEGSPITVSGMSINAGKDTITVTQAGVYAINASADLISASGTTQANMEIRYTGVGGNYRSFKYVDITATATHEISAQRMINLSAGDVIVITIANRTNSADYTLKNAQLTITRVD